ncbi:signal peptide peptidase SppA [Nocardioides houyundeii]|uniref:signal peptide peptidase SppA n=1 Tax=Nocardioides houyundeii TaxID=2045452 RepID=UPI000C778B37|nr:signal peptide peptidase SppA [Nocardioides houyundeii]
MKLPSLLSPVLTPVLRRVPLTSKAADQVLLELDLGRGVAENPPGSPIEALRSLHTPLLRSIVDHLRKAERDKDVVGLIAAIGDAPLTLAQSAELRAAVASFRAAGKATLAWSPSFGELGPGNTGYHLATAFEEVWLQPSGAVGLVGFAGEAVFLRAALDKIGVQPQLGQRHEYKTAADLFMRSEMSEPHREMITRLLESSTETLVSDVAADRGLEVAAVRAVLADAPVHAADAVTRGLVDTLGYRDQAYAAMRTRVGADPTLRYVERHGASKLEAVLGPMTRMPGHKSVIGLIQASGAIHLGRGDGGSPLSGSGVGSDALCAALRAAGRDEHVKAVVLRIDSPGGSYVASDAIRREIQVLREGGTPVVASMASVAASGGYFIAMPCDTILASPGTVTGSIGVLAGKNVLREGLQRIGVNRETVAVAPRAAMFSSNQPFSDDELAVLEGWLDEVYADFTAKAAADRKMGVEELRAVAKGRVWTGADAAERGLVDTLGGLDEAIAEACRLGRVDRDKAEVRTIPRHRPLQGLMPRESSEAVEARIASSTLLGVAEGPALWRRVLPELTGLFGTPYAGVLSLPPLRLPGLLPL